MSTKRTIKQTPSDKHYVVEVGYFKNKVVAEAKVLELKSKGFDAVIKEQKL